MHYTYDYKADKSCALRHHPRSFVIYYRIRRYYNTCGKQLYNSNLYTCKAAFELLVQNRYTRIKQSCKKSEEYSLERLTSTLRCWFLVMISAEEI